MIFKKHSVNNWLYLDFLLSIEHLRAVYYSFFWMSFRWLIVVKNLPENAGDRRNVDSVPGLGRSPGGGHGNPLQYSCLENSMRWGAQWATVHRVTKSWTPLKWLSIHTHTTLGQSCVKHMGDWSTTAQEGPQKNSRALTSCSVHTPRSLGLLLRLLDWGF